MHKEVALLLLLSLVICDVCDIISANWKKNN